LPPEVALAKRRTSRYERPARTPAQRAGARGLVLLDRGFALDRQVEQEGDPPSPSTAPRVFDAWGFDRCLWGTDWTRAFAVVNYEQAVEPFLKTARLSDTERATLMGGACAKAYAWSPKSD
jgi:hypothetical protein